MKYMLISVLYWGTFTLSIIIKVPCIGRDLFLQVSEGRKRPFYYKYIKMDTKPIKYIDGCFCPQ